jgi:hypothetical protein
MVPWGLRSGPGVVEEQNGSGDFARVRTECDHFGLWLGIE